MSFVKTFSPQFCQAATLLENDVLAESGIAGRGRGGHGKAHDDYGRIRFASGCSGSKVDVCMVSGVRR